MNIQAVLFKKNVSLKDRRKILNSMKLKQIKRVHKTDNYNRYRIEQPDYKHNIYRIKRLNKDIDVII